MARRLGLVLFALFVCVSGTGALYAEARIEANVIYGMYSGAALLMDVHHPDDPNEYGLIQIPGSAFQAPLSYGARPLKVGGRSPHLGTARLVDAATRSSR